MVTSPRRGCSIRGCTRRHKARGLCGAHYARWRRQAALSTGRHRASSHATALRRVRVARGPANEQRCSDAAARPRCGATTAATRPSASTPRPPLQPRPGPVPAVLPILPAAAGGEPTAAPRRPSPAGAGRRAGRTAVPGGGQLPRPRRPHGRLPGHRAAGAARPRRRDPPAGRPRLAAAPTPGPPTPPGTGRPPSDHRRTPPATNIDLHERHRHAHHQTPNHKTSTTTRRTTEPRTTDQHPRHQSGPTHQRSHGVCRVPCGPAAPEPQDPQAEEVVDHVEGAEGLRRRLLPRRHRQGPGRLLHRRGGGRGAAGDVVRPRRGGARPGRRGRPDDDEGALHARAGPARPGDRRPGDVA